MSYEELQEYYEKRWIEFSKRRNEQLLKEDREHEEFIKSITFNIKEECEDGVKI